MAKKSREHATTRQETVAQASGVALHAQAASDTPITATVPTCWVGPGSRLQKGDQEAREEALAITRILRDAESPGAGERGLQRLVD